MISDKNLLMQFFQKENSGAYMSVGKGIHLAFVYKVMK